MILVVANKSMRTVWKVTSGELLTKQTMRKKRLYTKNVYVLKLFLNIVTARIEALLIPRNKFLCACVKEGYLL
jgi:hypothetical protein